MAPAFPAPASERCTLTVHALEIAPHVDGIEVRFGPGPEVAIISPGVLAAKRARLSATYALVLLDQTLAQSARRRTA